MSKKKFIISFSLIGFFIPFAVFFTLYPFYDANNSFISFIENIFVFPLCFFLSVGGGHPPACVVYGIFSPIIWGVIGGLAAFLLSKYKQI